MNIANEIQLGLDVVTAVSVLVTAVYVVWSLRKEYKERREIELQDAEKLRKERISEAGSAVLVKEITHLAEFYRSFIKEQQDAMKVLAIFSQKENEDKQRHIKRIERAFKGDDIIDRTKKELKEFMSNFSDILEFIYSQRYTILPVIDAMTKSIDQELLIKVKEAPNNIADIFNQLVRFNALWNELTDTYSLYKKYNLSIEEISEKYKENSEYDLIIDKIVSIISDSDYQPYLKNVLFSKDKVQEKFKKDCSSEELTNMNIFQLSHIFDNEELVAFLFESVTRMARIDIAQSATEFKSIMCLLSTGYANILNDNKSESLKNTIARYEGLFNLNKEVR